MVTILNCNPHEDLKLPKYHNIGCKTRGKPRSRAEVFLRFLTLAETKKV